MYCHNYWSWSVKTMRASQQECKPRPRPNKSLEKSLDPAFVAFPKFTSILYLKDQDSPVVKI